MTLVTDFYKFKYSKSCYYVDLQINRDALLILENALDERLSNFIRRRDSECAYMRLKELFEENRSSTNDRYVSLRINKCYLKYIKNLCAYFSDRPDYIVLKALGDYMNIILVEDMETISRFSVLNEDIKIRVLSSI